MMAFFFSVASVAAVIGLVLSAIGAFHDLILLPRRRKRATRLRAQQEAPALDAVEETNTAKEHEAELVEFDRQLGIVPIAELAPDQKTVDEAILEAKQQVERYAQTAASYVVMPSQYQPFYRPRDLVGGSGEVGRPRVVDLELSSGKHLYFASAEEAQAEAARRATEDLRREQEKQKAENDAANQLAVKLTGNRVANCFATTTCYDAATDTFTTVKHSQPRGNH